MQDSNLQNEGGGDVTQSQDIADPKRPLLATIDPENNPIEHLELETSRKDDTARGKGGSEDEFGEDKLHGDGSDDGLSYDFNSGPSPALSKEVSPGRQDEPQFFPQKIANMSGSGSSLKKSLSMRSEKIDFSKEKPVGTELVIEKMLMYAQGEEDDLDDWNMLDSDLDADQPDHISYKKMMNEMLQREARYIDQNGHNVLYSVCGSRVGRHSSKRNVRLSELEELGPGVVLYFKMLKYYMVWFFLFICISLPTVMLCVSGQGFVNEEVISAKILAAPSLGGLNDYQNIACQYHDLNKETKQTFHIECAAGDTQHETQVEYTSEYEIKELVKFGLATGNRTCTGRQMETTVDTASYCSLGSMAQAKNEAILDEFNTKCVGQHDCKMEIDLQTMFDDTCNWQIQRRLQGEIAYGPSKLYVLARCEKDKVGYTKNSEGDLTREQGSVLIVCLDLLIMFLFWFSIVRLRWFENLCDRDRQLLKPMIEDFSIYIPAIPFSPEEYNQNEDLLTAKLAVSLEEILIRKFMEEEGLEELEAKDLSQVSSIKFGLNKHHSLAYLVKISNDAQSIGTLRKKTMFNQRGTHVYEKETWSLYKQITQQKQEYYKIRQQNWDPVFLNAYVTFRDIQARNKALEMFNRGNLRKLLAKNHKAFDKLYPQDLRLDDTAFLQVQPAVDPETISWENLGTPMPIKRKRIISSTIFTISVFLLSFIGIVLLAIFEKVRTNLDKNDCQGSSFFTNDEAIIDYYLDWPHQQGIMQCYCKQEYSIYGQKALLIMFEDGEQHCNQWYLIHFFQDYINFILSFYIAVVNYILQEVFDDIGKRRNTKNISDNYILRTLTMFLCQYINTAILYTFAYHSFMADDRLRVQNRIQDILIGPFDEFNKRWYVVIGTSITINSLIITIQPHIGLLVKAAILNIRRFIDRGCTQNKRKTQQVTQADYENLYTGPEFILQLRYSQILAQIFITITFSSGLPILYSITFVSLFISFWVDKYLMLRFFRKQNKFTSTLSASFVSLLPFAIIAHVIYGFFIFSHPNILKSTVVKGVIGNEYSKYWNESRVGQKHVIIFFFGAITLIIFLLFESEITAGFSFLFKQLQACYYKQVKKQDVPFDENEEMIDAPDLYWEINFDQLCKEFKLAKVEKQKYQMIKTKAQNNDKTFSQSDIKKYIDPCIEIFSRNEKDIKDRMKELVDKYIDRVPQDKLANIKTQDQKTIAVRKLYEEATDVDNPNRSKLNVQQDLHGRISNNVCSYDLMDNPKYQRIEECLEILNERLGETEQAHQLMKMKTFASNSQSAYLSMHRKMSSVNRLVAINQAFQNDRPESVGTDKSMKEDKEIQMADLEKLADDSGHGTPQRPQVEGVALENDQTVQVDQINQKVDVPKPTEGKDESCDKTQLLDDQGNATPGKAQIDNIFSPRSDGLKPKKSPKSKGKPKSPKIKSLSPKNAERTKSPTSNSPKTNYDTKSPKNSFREPPSQVYKSAISKNQVSIGKALKTAIPKLKQEMFKTESQPDREQAVDRVIQNQQNFMNNEEQAINKTQKKIIAEQMARVSQMRMTGNTIATPTQPRDMFHNSQDNKPRKFNFKTVKPRGPQMRKTQNDFLITKGSHMMPESEYVDTTKEGAMRRMQDERIKQTIKQIQKMQYQQKAQQAWNDRSRQSIDQKNSLASLQSASIYGKMPKDVMTMAKQNQMLKSAMEEHVRLQQQIVQIEDDKIESVMMETMRSRRSRSKSKESYKSNKSKSRSPNRSKSKSPDITNSRESSPGKRIGKAKRNSGTVIDMIDMTQQ